MIELFGMTPLRADILRYLWQHREGGTSGEIGRSLDANYRTVAKHLVTLEDLGAVESDADAQRQGVRVVYRIDAHGFDAAASQLLHYLKGK
ncbi:ArsR/SmtB family transcription factor [Arthrobacter castelli]|uniref:ArsR/SmtB family transcription factor n=1 Tax=Arthrobacter castelli TaxID=271431 RepID=UPI00056853B2|nr:helix-turn-helix domain-containing protein [Arthrobacter castelli]